MQTWKCVLTLDRQRKRVAGSEDNLSAAIRRGADLQIGTDFRYNEHIETQSDNDELVQEVSEFHVTYLLDNRWTAGIMTQRLPVEPPAGFGPRASMSFFMYNQDGHQAIARPFLDGKPSTGPLGPALTADTSDMPKMHIHNSWDADTNAPSTNFIYEFDEYRFFVRDDWKELLAHKADGEVISGSLEALTRACAKGAEVKVAVRGLCAELSENGSESIEHEVLVKAGWTYYHTKSSVLVAALHPLVRVAPAIPIRYSSRNWDFGWLVVRTDGDTARWMVDPYTLEFTKSDATSSLRWFVRR